GVAFINFIGHGNPKSLTHENLLTWSDVNSFRNTNLPFVYAATCNFMRWDDDDVSAAETLWLNPTAGVIGMICPSRTVYITLNGTLNLATARYMFTTDGTGRQLSMGDMMVNGKNSLASDNNRLRYGFIGDPSLSLPIPENEVVIETINGIPQDNNSDFPTFGARSKVTLSGSVITPDGSSADSFNGVVEISMFDAEKVVTTHGNGSEGKVDHYNDFKTLLYKGRVKVTGGKWETVINLPSEIDNNYTPALISMYAYDDAGNEANGSFNRFYVYGYDSEAPRDTDGPEIAECYLNNPGFSNGATVSHSPVLKAKISDASGINVSTSGIGHNMVIAIDNETYHNDVNLYYTPEVEDPCAGTIEYPLGGIEPGQHTLTLTVWDNANNSSTATLDFNIASDWHPGIVGLVADAAPAVTSVNFFVTTEGCDNSTSCRIEVKDLNGKTVWSGPAERMYEGNNSIAFNWNLTDNAGTRVPRGIYLYTAMLYGKEGLNETMTRKLAVAAP
ncbi:MAG: hypothetical protein K2G69_04440, partial [Muribaculaceae bacterium]|nr:hypothetical protein [Muribaculaceae bacterium]